MVVPRRMNTKQAAEYVGLSYRSLEKYRVCGGGPDYLKLGKRVVYDADDLDRWLNQFRRKVTSEPLKW